MALPPFLMGHLELLAPVFFLPLPGGQRGAIGDALGWASAAFCCTRVAKYLIFEPVTRKCADWSDSGGPVLQFGVR